MSIASEISRLQSAKADIKTAIEAKGVTVPSNATLDDYDTYVANIQTGTNYLPDYLNRSLSGALSSTQLGIITGKMLIPGFLDSLTNVTSVNLSDSTFTRIGDTTSTDNFCRGCTSLTSLTLPSTCTWINSNYFLNNTGITSYTIPSHITSISGTGFLGDNKNLTTLTIPSTITSLGTSFLRSSGTSSTYSGLQSLYYKASVASIPNYTAYKCDLLTYIDIASNVTTIGNYCFQASATVSDDLVVVLRNTNSMVQVTYNVGSQNGPFRYRTSVKVYVPQALKASYEADAKWTAGGYCTFYNLEGSIYE